MGVALCDPRGRWMRFSAFSFAAGMALLSAFSHHAWAADCKPLQLVNAVTLESIENDDRFAVPVQIDGHAEHLIVDSGTPLTMLFLDAAQRLGLSLRGTLATSSNVKGQQTAAQAIADTFDLGSAHAQNFNFNIFPGQVAGNGPAGLVSPTTFSRSDIDFDFGAKRLNIFSRDHCEGHVVYWPERPLAVIPMDTRSGHLNVPVMVDGRPMQAVLDTGATATVMTDTTAWGIMGIKAGSADAPEIAESKTGPSMKYYSHPFASLSFGGVDVQNPKIIIMTDRTGTETHPVGGTGSRLSTGGNARRPDLIVGMDVLTHLHIYVAYGEEKLYITPAGTVSVLPPLAQSSAAPN
jgi:predicted aspartyl protease